MQVNPVPQEEAFERSNQRDKRSCAERRSHADREFRQLLKKAGNGCSARDFERSVKYREQQFKGAWSEVSGACWEEGGSDREYKSLNGTQIQLHSPSRRVQPMAPMSDRQTPQRRPLEDAFGPGGTYERFQAVRGTWTPLGAAGPRPTRGDPMQTAVCASTESYTIPG